MAFLEENGFNFFVDLDGTKTIIIDSKRIDDCMQIFMENNLKGIAITWSLGYRLKNIDFVKQYLGIEYISISEEIEDISALSTLKNLRSLQLSGKNRKVDFSNFPLLTVLNVDWSNRFSNLENCIYLKKVYVFKYNPKENDSSTLSCIPWIESLEITQSTMQNLSSLESLNQLKEVAINYCRDLKKLCCLVESKDSIRTLLFDHCKKIENHEYVTRLHDLNILAYNNCGLIPSIGFIQKMASLESFRVMGTDIQDGDMTPCIGLKYAAFSNKRHFSHTIEQIRKINLK